MPEKYEFLGNRVHSARESCKMTQQELANQSGLTVKTILDIEKGRKNATYETLSQLIEQLGISANFLFSPAVSIEDSDLQRFMAKIQSCDPKYRELLLKILDCLMEQLSRLQEEPEMER